MRQNPTFWWDIIHPTPGAATKDNLERNAPLGCASGTALTPLCGALIPAVVVCVVDEAPDGVGTAGVGADCDVVAAAEM